MTTGTQARDVLTQAEAEARAAHVSQRRLRARYSTSRAAPKLTEATRPSTSTSLAEGDTFLDFRGKRIDRFEVNGGRARARLLWTGYRLTIPADALAPENIVRVVYENEYDHTGDGFHQFIDPEDGEEYLYSNFEPYESHRLFPNFDQPDIKASYTLTVIAPAELGADQQRPLESQRGDRRRPPASHLRDDRSRLAPTSSR